MHLSRDPVFFVLGERKRLNGLESNRGLHQERAEHLQVRQTARPPFPVRVRHHRDDDLHLVDFFSGAVAEVGQRVHVEQDAQRRDGLSQVVIWDSNRR